MRFHHWFWSVCVTLGCWAGPSSWEAGRGASWRRVGCSPGPAGGVAGGSPPCPCQQREGVAVLSVYSRPFQFCGSGCSTPTPSPLPWGPRVAASAGWLLCPQGPLSSDALSRVSQSTLKCCLSLEGWWMLLFLTVPLPSVYDVLATPPSSLASDILVSKASGPSPFPTYRTSLWLSFFICQVVIMRVSTSLCCCGI